MIRHVFNKQKGWNPAGTILWREGREDIDLMRTETFSAIYRLNNASHCMWEDRQQCHTSIEHKTPVPHFNRTYWCLRLVTPMIRVPCWFHPDSAIKPTALYTGAALTPHSNGLIIAIKESFVLSSIHSNLWHRIHYIQYKCSNYYKNSLITITTFFRYIYKLCKSLRKVNLFLYYIVAPSYSLRIV